MDKVQTEAQGKRDLYILFALVVISAALGGTAQTAPNAMSPTIMSEYGIEVSLGQWLTTIYMLVMGIVVPLSTFFSRKMSARNHVLISLAFFSVGMFISWIAPNFAVMVVARVLQATACGLLTPLMQNIAVMRFPPGKRATAMGVAGIALGFAPNIGPTIGGMMEAAWGWRSFFVLMLAIGVLLAVLTIAFVKPEQPMMPGAQFETVSFVYSTLGFGGLLLGISQASSFGFASLAVWIPIAVGFVFLLLFVRRQHQVEQPLIHLEIFANRQYLLGSFVLIFLFGSFMGVTLVIPLYVQNLCGGTSLDAGMVLLPATVFALILNPVSGWATDKFGIRPVVLFFGACLVAGSLLWILADEGTSIPLMMLYQTVRGFGISGLIGPIQVWTLDKLDKPLVPDGSSVSILVRQAAASFGTSMMVLAIASSVALAAEMSMPALPYHLAFGVSAAFAICTYALIIAKVK